MSSGNPKRLCFNGAGCLVQINDRYWLIESDWYFTILPDAIESDHQALLWFKNQLGEPVWVRNN